ncbi:MAG TPA: MFS transporter [Candidatus Sulfopaludibacter sp.]|nr:MFS transporter [Candidatus Sulfopaludibacter sp.]
MRISKLSAPTVVLALLCAMYFLYFVDRVSISTAAPLIKADLKISNTQLGLAFSAFAIPYALFQLIGGWIGDRLGPRLTLAICCAMVGISTALMGAVTGIASLILLRLALGFGEGAGFPTATRAMASWTPQGNWGFAQGIVHSFARIGNAVTPPIMAGLLLFSNWRGTFVMLGAVSLLWLVVWAWYFRNDPRQHPSMTAALLETLPVRAVGAARTIPWLQLARHVLPLTIVDFCYGWTLWLFLTWIPAFFFENYHQNLQASALFSGGVLLAGVIGDTAGGVATDRLLRKTGSLVIARRGVIVAGFLGGFIFLIPVVMIHNLTVAAVCLSLAFFFAELIVGPIWSVPMDIAPRYAGTASGMMNFGFGVAGLVSPLSFGYLVDRTGSWVVPFVASILLLLLGAVLALRLRPDRPFVEDTRTVAEPVTR